MVLMRDGKGYTLQGKTLEERDATIDSKIATHAADYGLHTKVVRKTADETVNNSTTLQNDDHLYFAMGANEVWYVEIFLIIDSSTSADFKSGLSLPSGATAHWMAIGSSEATISNIVATGLTETNSDASWGTGAGTPRLRDILSIIVINDATAGNFQLQWAQNTAEASDTILKTNSCLIAHKLA